MKASVKGIPYAVSQGVSAGFTIAAILRTAAMAGIRFMATGGIGGVARGGELSMDVSADLEEMARSSVAIISAGCKSILDIGRTKEYLETKDVPVIGMGCDSFPAFFTPYSEYRIDYRIDDYDQVAKFVREKWSMGFPGAVILSNPVPKEFAFDEAVINKAIAEAVEQAQEQGIAGEKEYTVSAFQSLRGNRRRQPAHQCRDRTQQCTGSCYHCKALLRNEGINLFGDPAPFAGQAFSAKGAVTMDRQKELSLLRRAMAEAEAAIRRGDEPYGAVIATPQG